VAKRGPVAGDVELLRDPTLISIDPGGTTGYSVITVHPEALCGEYSILRNILHWSHGQFVGPENDQASQVLGLIDQFPGCAVLIEDFILRTSVSSREVLSPVRITAKIEYGLFLAGAEVPVFKQMPSEAMRVATDERLKAWGFYQREGGLEHARDGDRHGLTWLRKCKQKAFMRRQCWPHIFGEGGEYAEPTVADDDEDEEELG